MRKSTQVYLSGALIQEMIWERSGSSLMLSGPPEICEAVKAAFSEGAPPPKMVGLSPQENHRKKYQNHDGHFW